MHQEQRVRARDLLNEQDIRQALFANSTTIKWLTGFAPPPQVGASPFAAGPPLLIYADGHYTLVILDALAGFAGEFNQAPDCTVLSYGGYTIEEPIAGARNLETVLKPILTGTLTRGRLGIEAQDLPVAVERLISAGVESIPIDGWLTPLRMIKTEAELDRLRVNFALTDIGHAAARKHLRAGIREIDVWAFVHSAVEKAAGQRVAMGNDCVVNYRQANIGGWPGDLIVKEGDSLILDLSTLLHGYWSDSCATYYAGEPSNHQIAMHETAEQALDYARSLVKPGTPAAEIDRKVRSFIGDAGYPVYPHHTGHGVGVTGHEEPRIVPYNDEITLQENMVILLEPGIYFPGEAAVRLEDAVLVKAAGNEVLTKHDKGLP